MVLGERYSYQAQLNKQVKAAEKAFMTQLKSLKPLVFEEAMSWLNSKIDDICSAFTTELHEVIKQFLEFKQKTFSRIAEVAWYQENVKILELTLARKIPVFDAEYGMHEATPIRLYSSLVPRLRENKKKYFDPRGHLKMDDFVA